MGGGAKRGMGDRDRPWFSPISIKTVFVCVCSKSIIRYVKDVPLTELTVMSGPKRMGEKCKVAFFFVINRTFLNKYSENQNNLMNKMSFISNFTYTVRISLGSVKK